MTTDGIDVSNYQAGNYGTSGLDFVFVKATEGTGYVNPKHAAQVATARAAGLVVGHYHFARPGSMSAQADYFLKHAGAKAGDVLAFDWEDTGVSGAEKDAWLRNVQAKAPGHRVILYANRDFWLHRDSTSFCANGLWIADPSAPKGHPRVEHPWLFHQYSEAGGVDHNAGNFTNRAALHAWAAGTTEEDDMPLSADDINKVAAATCNKLIAAGGVLEASDLARIFTAMIHTDGVLPAPADSADHATNPFWTWQSHIISQTSTGRQAVAQLGALAAAVAALKADGGITPEQLTASAEAGARAALAELGDALTTAGPAQS